MLLAGGQDVYANTHQQAVHKNLKHDVTKNHHVKFTGRNSDSTVIEDTDLDLEEECVSVKDGGTNKFFIDKYSFPHNRSSVLAYCNNYFTQFRNFPVNFGHSSPIYIVHRVLRI